MSPFPIGPGPYEPDILPLAAQANLTGSAAKDEELSSLSFIRSKIRRLTRSPSSSQLTNAQIDDYVNTFILYDFPEFTVDAKLVFYTFPNVDTYGTNVVNDNDPLYNFKNNILSVQAPVYVAGQQVGFYQSRDEFYLQYSKYETEESIGTGNGVLTTYSGTLDATPILANSVTFSSTNVDGDPIILRDINDIESTTGNQAQFGTLVDPNDPTTRGAISYLSGGYTFTFTEPPGSGNDIIASSYRYAAGRPTSVLYENRQFTFRPVPDKTYKVEIDAFRRPTSLLTTNDVPDLAQWWQYIAYGAAKKVFEDRMDVESVQAILPEFMNQRSMVLRKLVVQQSSERTATIYANRGAGFDVNKDTF